MLNILKTLVVVTGSVAIGVINLATTAVSGKEVISEQTVNKLIDLV